MAQQSCKTQRLKSISQDVLSEALPLRNRIRAPAEGLGNEGEGESAEEEEGDDMDIFRPLLDALKLDMLADLAIRYRQSQEEPPDGLTSTAQVNLEGELRRSVAIVV
jgi:hypothetical protein